MTDTARPVGRFAPSPTGPLHFGSLLAAAASYLQVRSRGGRWLLRIEDIDPPREQPGATSLILRALERYGFEWDGSILYQSAQRRRHLDAVHSLRERGLAYPCGCSRRDLRGARHGPLGIVYPGTCRKGCDADEYAIRVLTTDEPLAFTDALQGPQSQRLQSESGDFVILRRDGLIAYNLAVVVDDADQGVTEVLRGIDLLDSTPRHIHLQRLLDLPTPEYLHIPVAENGRGQKLSKLTGAAALPLTDPRPTLVAALRALGQPADGHLEAASVAEIWSRATARWDSQVLAGRRRIDVAANPLANTKNGLS